MFDFLPKRAKSLCLENPVDRGPWWTTVHEVAESDRTEATQHACKVLTTGGSLVALWQRARLPTQETQEMQARPLGQDDPLGEAWQPTPIFLPEKFHGQRSSVTEVTCPHVTTKEQAYAWHKPFSNIRICHI